MTDGRTQATTIPEGQYWPRVTIGHLFYAASSFVHHFIAISEFKLELQSGNAKFGSISMIFCLMQPSNFADDLEQGKSEGFDSSDRPSNLTQIGFKSSIFQPVLPWNLMDDSRKIIGHLFYMTSSFVHHFKYIGELKLELQSGNAQFGSKLVIFLSCVTLKFEGWPWKSIGHLFYVASSIVHHFMAISEIKLQLQSGNAKLG